MVSLESTDLARVIGGGLASKFAHGIDSAAGALYSGWKDLDCNTKSMAVSAAASTAAGLAVLAGLPAGVALVAIPGMTAVSSMTYNEGCKVSGST